MAPSNSTRAYLREAIGFWEPRRIAYNLALACVSAFWLTRDWHHFRQGLHPQLLLVLLVLAILANVCYSAAYIVDLSLQYTSIKGGWIKRRTWLWIAGLMFAILLASYWINDEIYPGFGAVTPHETALIQNA